MSPIRVSILLFAFASLCHAQQFERMEISFEMEDHELAYPLVGGLNAPQYSPAHLDGDSLLDLFVFDRSGNKVLTFTGQSDGTYRYTPELEQLFPPLESWALLRDFNGDSIIDIFSFSTTGIPGIDVYQGTKTGKDLDFERIVFDNGLGVLSYPAGSGGETNLYVSAIDVPAIKDVDGDGDFDVLSFQADGTRVFYYRNLSVEQGKNLDTLVFILEDRCWGKFVEAFNTNDVVLSDDPDVCPEEFVSLQRLHSGSTVTAFDPDLDGDQDLLLGDISFETLLFLSNGGDADKAFMTAQTQNFPTYDQSVDIPFFPVAFIDHFDDDQIVDMLVAPNAEDARENTRVGWFYRGTIENNQVRFRLQQKDLLVADMLDFGTDASPTLADINADGKFDLVVGSRFHQDYDNAAPSQLFLFENIGSRSTPAFKLIDENWLELKNQIEEVDALKPVFVDLDNDQDLDLFIGNKRGKIIYIENIAIAGGSFTPGSITYPWLDIDVGFAASPAFADVDADGDLDLLVGEERGNVNFFLNQGDAENPVFDSNVDAPGNLEDFGQIDARQDRAVFGAATPQVFESGDTTYLSVGTAFGNFLSYDLYQQVDSFLTLDIELNQIFDGGRSQLGLADLNDDGFLEVVSGNSRGGLVFYRTGLRVGASVNATEQLPPGIQWSVFPNPTSSILYIESDVSLQGFILRNQLGQTILEELNIDSRNVEVNISHVTPGVYYLSIHSDAGIGTKRLLIQN